MKDQLLGLELRVLLLRYGRSRVLETLAALGEQSLEQIEEQVRLVEQRRGTRSKQVKARSFMDLIDAEGRVRPEIAEPLRDLAIKFENRAFLPNLRDVRRFLDQAGEGPRALKSRAAAAPALVAVLSRLPREELVRLAADTASSGESDYSLLSRAIMRTGSNS